MCNYKQIIFVFRYFLFRKKEIAHWAKWLNQEFMHNKSVVQQKRFPNGF